MKLENRGNGCYHNLATTTEAFENIIPSSGCSGDMNFFLVRGIPPRDVREENAFYKMVVFDVCCTVSNQNGQEYITLSYSSSFIESSFRVAEGLETGCFCCRLYGFKSKWAGIHHPFFPLPHLLKLVQGGRGFRHTSIMYLYELVSREYCGIIDKY